jgi:predicted Ser/Thr protein kinase
MEIYMSVKDVLFSVLNEEKQTMADDYIRMNEVLEFVYSYFAFNIDDVAGEQIEKLTLNELSHILQKKINRYKKYVRTDTVGVFAEQS